MKYHGDISGHCNSAIDLAVLLIRFLRAIRNHYYVLQPLLAHIDQCELMALLNRLALISLGVRLNFLLILLKINGASHRNSLQCVARFRSIPYSFFSTDLNSFPRYVLPG